MDLTEAGMMDGDKRALAALLFLASGTNALDVYSALNSSPWTAENFGANEAKAKSCREYVVHSVIITTFFGGTSAIIGKSWWPIFGTLLANGYMVWLYERALYRGATAGSDGWGS